MFTIIIIIKLNPNSY